MMFTKKTKCFQTVTALVALGLLATACGAESKKQQRPQSIHVELDGPIVVPTPVPEVTPTPNVMPTPDVIVEDKLPPAKDTSESIPDVIATPAPEVESEPAPEVESKPAPEAPVKHPLPASRDLTEAEKLDYLTNNDSFITISSSHHPRGTGYNIEKKSFRANCMAQDENITILETDMRPQEEYVILPLTSNRQVKAALGYKGHSLGISGQVQMDDPQKLGIIAIAKKIRRVESLESLVLNTSFQDISDDMFDTRCGQVYKKGEVLGHYYAMVLWIELDANTTREAVLSRLIDSQTLGMYSDQESFSKNLASLDRQLTDSEGLFFVGGGKFFNLRDTMSFDHGFDFSAGLKAWTKASDQVELAKVPIIGSIFDSYPGRSTPSDITGGKSQ